MFKIGEKVVCIKSKVSAPEYGSHKIIENQVYTVVGVSECKPCDRAYISVGQSIGRSMHTTCTKCGIGAKTFTDELYWNAKFFAPLDDWADATSCVEEMMRELKKKEAFIVEV